MKKSFTIKALEAFDPELESFTFPYWLSVFRELGNQVSEAGRGFALAAVSDDGEKIGLLLGRLEEGAPQRASFLSIYVLPHWRGTGVGTALWEAAEVLVRKAGADSATVNYVLGKPSIPFLEKILERQAWSAPRLNMYVVGLDLKRIRNARFLRDRSLPDDYEIVLWRDLPQSAIEALVARDATAPWIPSDLKPTKFLENYQEDISVALLRRGDVCGWLILHLIHDVLRLTCGFVHPRLQRRGRMFDIYVDAARRAERLGFCRISATVPAHHPGMAAFAQRWLQPMSERFSESRVAAKEL